MSVWLVRFETAGVRDPREIEADDPISDCAEGDVVRRMRGPAEYNVLKAAAGEPAWTFQPPTPPRCRTCPVPPVSDAPIAWSEQWHTYLCAECAALLAEEKADG